MNARFWILHKGSPVRITLTPGIVRECASYQKTDEGCSFEWCQWFLDDDSGRVFRDYSTGGVDCDGRLEHFGSDNCPINKLQSRPVEFGGETLLWPDWQDQETEVFDQYAQLDNY